ncbi:MAG: hypothetical protein ACREQA_22870, partial [Candidatus Binatia bacterium]
MPSFQWQFLCNFPIIPLMESRRSRKGSHYCFHIYHADGEWRRGSPRTLERIRIGYATSSGQTSPLWVTQDAGVFKKNGLDRPYHRPAPISGRCSSSSFIEHQSEICRRVIRALVEGIHFLKTNRQESRRIIGRRMRITDEEIIEANYTQQGLT